MNFDRINYVNSYFIKLFGERTLKICIDGGFTCPNRDGTKSCNGCIFCSEKGSGEHLKSSLSIFDQVKNAFNSIKITRANKFILYFQNYTNTYDSIQNLNKKYDEAISAFNTLSEEYYLKENIKKELVGLQIATRPDCITEDIAKFLSTYKSKLHVFVELGLQTSNEKTGKFVNRCYTNDDFSNAVLILNKYNIDIIAHIMIGLPTIKNNLQTIEDHNDTINTVSFINKHNIQGLKIHSTYIVKNTYLEKLFIESLYSPMSLDYYLEELSYVITHVSKDIIIHRISGDAPKDLLVAPLWNLHKKWILNGIYKKLNDKDLYQGIYYKK